MFKSYLIKKYSTNKDYEKYLSNKTRSNKYTTYQLLELCENCGYPLGKHGHSFDCIHKDEKSIIGFTYTLYPEFKITLKIKIL